MPTRGHRVEIHKALADDTRFRLHRYLGLSARAVSVRELSTRLVAASQHAPAAPAPARGGRARPARGPARGARSAGRRRSTWRSTRPERENRDFRLLAESLPAWPRARSTESRRRPREGVGRVPRDPRRPETGRPGPRRTQPRRAPGGDVRRWVRPPLPPRGGRGRGDAARLPVPRAARGPPLSRVRGPPRARSRGCSGRCLRRSRRAEGFRASHRARDLPLLRPPRLTFDQSLLGLGEGREGLGRGGAHPSSSFQPARLHAAAPAGEDPPPARVARSGWQLPGPAFPSPGRRASRLPRPRHRGGCRPPGRRAGRRALSRPPARARGSRRRPREAAARPRTAR